MQAVIYNARMKNDQANRNNGKQSPKKLTLLFVLLPILVVALMVVFWVIFKETRKQVQADVDSHILTFAHVQTVRDVSADQHQNT